VNTQVSTPIKIFAGIGLLLILGVGGMTLMKGGGSPPPASSDVVTHGAVTQPAVTQPAVSPAATHPAVTHPAVTHAAATTPSAHAAATAPAATSPATTTPAAHAPVTTPSHAATPHVTAPVATTPAHAKAKPAAAPSAVAADGLPAPLDLLLHIHQVVVVAVWDPEVPTDKLFVAEAKAGAQDAHAGFLAVSVLDNKVAGPLTSAAGNGSLLPSPGLLVYKQPALLMNVLTGFVDRAAVVQAVANALTSDQPVQSTPTPAATTTTP
jgi:hypothetical protein